MNEIPRYGQIIVYDNPTSGESINVRGNADGTFYGTADKFDFHAASEADLVARLQRWGFTVVAGYDAVACGQA